MKYSVINCTALCDSKDSHKSLLYMIQFNLPYLIRVFWFPNFFLGTFLLFSFIKTEIKKQKGHNYLVATCFLLLIFNLLLLIKPFSGKSCLQEGWRQTPFGLLWRPGTRCWDNMSVWRTRCIFLNCFQLQHLFLRVLGLVFNYHSWIDAANEFKSSLWCLCFWKMIDWCLILLTGRWFEQIK